jgi:hypothetical protein
MFTDFTFRLTFNDSIFEFNKKITVMQYVLQYPKSYESWYRQLIESIEAWLTKRTIRNFIENDLLID